LQGAPELPYFRISISKQIAGGLGGVFPEFG